MFEKKSKEELEVMVELYKTICGDEIKNSILNDGDVKIYELSRRINN